MKNYPFIFICILAFKPNFKVLFGRKYKTDEQNYRI